MVKEIIQRIDRLESLLLAKKETLTVDEFSKYSGLSKSAIYKLTADRKLAHSCPNGKKIYVSIADATEFLQRNRVPSTFEINVAAANYVTLNPNRIGGAL